jgi:tetratricopeptide (TPR) repeat protein
LPKTKTAQVGHTLEEIQSLGDRLAHWTNEHWQLVTAVAVSILVASAGAGLYASLREDARTQASAALAEVEDAYRDAMGTPADALTVTEPANPATARETRERFAKRFSQVAQEHAGTPAAALALLRAGSLREAMGETDAAIALWQEAAGHVGTDDPVRALLLTRIGSAYEREGQLLEAAEAYERAGDVVDYPLRPAAWTAAARCYADAGEPDRALQVWDRLSAEAPEAAAAPYVAARMAEIRALRAAP